MTTTITLPAGWRVERTEKRHLIAFEIYEEGGATWTTGEPRPALDVEYWPNEGETRYGGQPIGPEISWPSTTDKRPELALALAAALQMAAAEAM